jgi:putative Holliday junction resolvase
MRVLAIDYGNTRTGVSVSDPMGIIAGESFTINEKDMGRLIGTLSSLCREKGVGHIVVGNPKHMNADEGDRSEMSKNLAKRLEEKLNIPVSLWDERLTSTAAHRILNDTDTRGKKRKNTVDAVAASLILEGYLNSTVSI